MPHRLPLSGDLTIFEVATVHDTIMKILHDGPVELDLSGITRIDASGVQLLLAIAHAGQGTIVRKAPCVDDAMTRLGCP